MHRLGDGINGAVAFFNFIKGNGERMTTRIKPAKSTKAKPTLDDFPREVMWAAANAAYEAANDKLMEWVETQIPAGLAAAAAVAVAALEAWDDVLHEGTIWAMETGY